MEKWEIEERLRGLDLQQAQTVHCRKIQILTGEPTQIKLKITQNKLYEIQRVAMGILRLKDPHNPDKNLEFINMPSAFVEVFREMVDDQEIPDHWPPDAVLFPRPEPVVPIASTLASDDQKDDVAPEEDEETEPERTVKVG